jgi:uncharacterized membrane protein
MNHILLISVFLACTVEMIEALTIILAIGTVRHWKPTMQGAVSALILLGLIILIFGPAIERIPRQLLWLIIGGLLLVFGLQWLRNAILRYSGLKAIHDESETYKKVTKEARKTKIKRFEVTDWYAFVIVFKGVFLEGLEVVFIVLSLASVPGGLRLGVYASLAAFITVTLLGVLVKRPLAKIPENTMKFVVGILLTTFGTYYCGRGIGLTWVGGQLGFAHILLFYAFATTGMVLIFVKRNEIRDNASKD